MPVETGIQVTDRVRHTVGSLPRTRSGDGIQVKGMGMDSGFHRNDENEIDLLVVSKQKGRAEFPVTNPENSPPLLN